jgi:DNA polymerase-3 subunit epsilon
VFTIFNESGTLIYIGKSINIRKRNFQHLQVLLLIVLKKFKLSICRILRRNRSELVLKESEEIKKNKPKYNRAQRKSIFQWALYPEMDEKVI